MTTQSSKLERANGAFIWPVRVYYEDTDAGGVVYYANYLRFMERARTEWLRHLGFDQDRLAREQGLLFAVRSVMLDYLLPARLDDELEVSASVQPPGRASIRFAQTVVRVSGPNAPELLTRGEVKIACLDAGDFRPRSIPDPILKALSAPEAETRER
ncbi:tol-pal system-associated acyl-CoA thioesterase [Thioalkalivibrio denitrificans]|uniref:Tol-pal system-associated acyl-CoA thioesterase n=1 Tax=Thioalkalivibrio denitrificans TaxID=108003 RepID=A0A1V3NKZ0_9GAMM|nr:tol-pal system-associated acyl-CoA thioesterase [Thioalkalivibrio denitrificans]OOG25613.1 tol-pal system-associated acyl-CoA thioesterase [Thioalkalivibrio denitrificans]